MAPLLERTTKRRSRAEAFNNLRRVFNAIETRFASLCAEETFDDLHAILRRAPAGLMPGSNWLKYMTLGIAKYTRLTGSTVEVVSVEDTHVMFHRWSEYLLLKADLIASLAGLMDEVASVMRWVGKGATHSPTEADPLRFDAKNDVKRAVDSYEARREVRLFSDQGILMQDSGIAPSLPIFCLGHTSLTVWLRDQSNDRNLIVNFPPSILDWGKVIRVLESCREAIEDLFGLSLEAVSQGICGITQIFDLRY